MSTWRRVVDNAIVRAHEDAAGAQKRRHASNRALARRTQSQGPHGCGRVWQSGAMAAYGGEVHDITQAPAFIAGIHPKQVIVRKL